MILKKNQHPLASTPRNITSRDYERPLKWNENREGTYLKSLVKIQYVQLLNAILLKCLRLLIIYSIFSIADK